MEVQGMASSSTSSPATAAAPAATALPFNMNKQIHTASLEIETRSLSHVLYISPIGRNDMDDTGHFLFLTLMRMAVVVIVAMMVVVMSMPTSSILLVHPHSHACISNYAPQFPYTLQPFATTILCLLR